MSSIFGIFNTAKRGMQAQTFAIHTTSHNISNANTEGFSRQRANMQASLAYSYVGVGQLGTGVDVTGVQRIRDGFLDAQIWYENSINGRFTSSESVLEQVEMIFLEPSDIGINSALDQLWSGWQQLSKTPEGSTARTVVAQTSSTFADTLNHTSFQLDTLKSDTISLIEGKTYEANKLISQIQEVSDQIYKLEMKDLTPNDLHDRRGVLIDQLSSLVNINTEYDEFSRVRITDADTNAVILDFHTQDPPSSEMSVIRSAVNDGMGNQMLTVLRGGDITKVETLTVPADTFSDGDIVYAAPDEWDTYEGGGVEPTLIKANLEEGELAGNVQSLNKVVEYQKELDKLAYSIAEAINFIHSELSGIPFFTTKDGLATFTANNIQVNSDILSDPTKIHAGKTFPSSSGDGSRALAIAQLRDATFRMTNSTDFSNYLSDPANYDSDTMTIKDDPAGTTFEGYFKDIVAKIGIDTKQVKNGVENQTILLLQLEQRRESISGVSIDEEVANLVQFQNAYQANARVITTLTDMLDTLINRMAV